MAEYKPMSGRERDALYSLFGATSLVCRIIKDSALDKRLNEIKYGSRDIKMCASVLDKLCGKLINTAPTKQLYQMKHDIPLMRVCTTIKPVADPATDDGRWLSFEDLEVLGGAVLHNVCPMCSGTGEEYNKCKIRKVLDNLPTGRDDTDDTRGGKCPYAVWM